METPLVSVVIGHYDNVEYLPMAINSVLDQTYEPVEVVVVDSSGEIDQVATKYDDDVRFFFQEERGPAAKWNKGIQEAEGEFIAFLGADDYLRRDRFDIQLPVLLYDEYDIVYSDQYLVKGDTVTRDESMELDPETEPHVQFFRQWGGVGTLTVLLRAECLAEERFETSLEANEDYHLWIRLFREYRVARVAEAVTYKRVLDTALTSDHGMVYENALEASELLLDRYPELEAHEDETMREIHRRFGLWLMAEGNWTAARRALRTALRYEFDRVAFGVYLLSALPVPDGTKDRIKRTLIGLNRRFL